MSPSDCAIVQLQVRQAFVVEADDDAASGDDYGTTNQAGLTGHHANGFAAGGRIFGKILFAINLATGVEEIGMVTRADQLFKFGGLQGARSGSIS